MTSNKTLHISDLYFSRGTFVNILKLCGKLGFLKGFHGKPDFFTLESHLNRHS